MSMKGPRTSREFVEAARACLTDTNFSPAKAGDLLTSALQQDPTLANALVLRSNLASRLGELSTATADLSLAIEVERGSNDTRRVASLYGSRSTLLARAGRHTDAVADLRAALKCEPDNGVWAFELGRVYLKTGSVSLAQVCFQQALQEPMWSHVGESTRSKVYALYGRSCLMSRDYKKAKALLRKSLEVGGEGAAVLHDVGLAHYHESTTPTFAIDFFARATKLDPQPVEYPLHLALTHTRCGNYHDALSSMNEAVLRGQEAALLRFYRGCVELQLGLGPQALADLQASAGQPADMWEGHRAVAVGKRTSPPLRSSETSPSPPAWIAMAFVHFFCEQSLERAASCLAEALRKNLDRQQCILAGTLLGIVLRQQGETFAALRVLSDVVAAMASAKRSGGHGDSGASRHPSAATVTSIFDNCFEADMELLVLTHVGLAYSACGYADLALRFFTQARQRTQQRGGTTLLSSCLFREAVAQVELGDVWGALQTLQSSPSATPPGNNVGHRSSNSGTASLSFISTVPAASGDFSAPLMSSSGAALANNSSKRPQASPQHPPADPQQISSPAVPSLSFLTLHQQSPAETSHLYAVTLRRLGRLSEALQFATAAVEAQQAAAAAPDVPAYLYNRALICFLLRNYDDAMRDVQVCIKACTVDGAPAAMSADSHYLQGCIEHATGDFPASLKSLTAALSVDEALRNSPAFSYSYGVLLAIAGLHEAAVDAFTAAVEQSSLAGGTEAEAGVARVAVGGGGGGGALGCPAVYHHERAKSYQQLGRYAEALADYNCVLPKSLVSVLPASASDASRSQVTEPVNWNALVNRALTLKELQWYDAAAADWDAALRMDRSGCLAQFTSQDIFEMSYMELCLPGCELYEFNTM